MASVNSLAKPNAASAATIESWEQRETIEVLKIALFKLTGFLNGFEASTKHRLGELNEKMDRLDRQVGVLEASFTSAVDELNR